MSDAVKIKKPVKLSKGRDWAHKVDLKMDISNFEELIPEPAKEASRNVVDHLFVLLRVLILIDLFCILVSFQTIRFSETSYLLFGTSGFCICCRTYVSWKDRYCGICHCFGDEAYDTVCYFCTCKNIYDKFTCAYYFILLATLACLQYYLYITN